MFIIKRLNLESYNIFPLQKQCNNVTLSKKALAAITAYVLQYITVYTLYIGLVSNIVMLLVYILVYK
jgi:hypothetical protein